MQKEREKAEELTEKVEEVAAQGFDREKQLEAKVRRFCLKSCAIRNQSCCLVVLARLLSYFGWSSIVQCNVVTCVFLRVVVR